MIKIENILEVEKYLDGIKVAIFDLDDTLYSEKDYVRSGYEAVALEFPNISNMAEKLWNVFERGGNAFDEVLVFEKLYTEETKAKCLQTYRNHKPNISLYLGVKNMLERIKKRKIKLGLITDGRPEGQRAKIKALGIECLFDKIIITDELGGIEFRKPNSKAFIKMKEFFDTPYEQMFYVGDNIKKDLIAPQELGMKAILYKNTIGLYIVNIGFERK